MERGLGRGHNLDNMDWGTEKDILELGKGMLGGRNALVGIQVRKTAKVPA